MPGANFLFLIDDRGQLLDFCGCPRSMIWMLHSNLSILIISLDTPELSFSTDSYIGCPRVVFQLLIVFNGCPHLIQILGAFAGSHPVGTPRLRSTVLYRRGNPDPNPEPDTCFCFWRGGCELGDTVLLEAELWERLEKCFHTNHIAHPWGKAKINSCLEIERCFIHGYVTNSK